MVKRPRIWIVDGHNLIFQIPHLEELQVTQRRHEARRGLEKIFSRYSMRSGERVIIVYDGNRLEQNPDVVSSEYLETIYTFQPEEADDRIQYLASQYLSHGCRVRVLTSDLRTLSPGLPAGAVIVSPIDFFKELAGRPENPDEKRIKGDFSDVEAELLKRGGGWPEEEEIPPPPPSGLPVRPVPARQKRKTAATVPEKPMPQAAEMSREAREALRKKKERGRRKQQRRLQKEK
ncbi:MAG: NYN domain-containing protein [Candidatus Eisenbacteria bacterium]|uniref:NYN domain-containing protein n=1 Tax=Eiseniibacteriota bacterium TaxID=2212470 RepID=A0A948RTZ3_UNCEI|nr:NYN domain-containing protein [Candidatus Eisenbacteria bacterium]MBU1948206.1 NYN domain-containing protein [Candidatus Eisenbacteria bacterium]MBU2689669.1 NYN domain-containing protein [Candidatus Eisenbacteria bacterium]